MLGFAHCQIISAFCFLSFFLSFILKTKLISILVAATVKSFAFHSYETVKDMYSFGLVWGG